MKTDFYTKTVLTVIAICLAVQVFKDNPFIQTANANDNKRFVTVPLNPDGSINVVVKQVRGDQRVIITGWEGELKTYKMHEAPLPVKNKP